MGMNYASAGLTYRTGALAAALALGVALCAAPDARAAEGDWYMGLQVPIMFIDDTESTTTGNQLGVAYKAEATTEYKAGFKVAGVVGYELGGGLRVEGELFFASAKVDKLTYGGLRMFGGTLPFKVPVDVSGSAKQFGGFTSIWYDFRTGTDWFPYFGGGLGFIRVDQGGLNYDANTLFQNTVSKLQDPTVVAALNPAQRAAVQAALGDPSLTAGLASLEVPEISAADTKFAYHIGMGIGYRLNDKTTLQLGYRLQNASGLEFDGRNAQGTIGVETDLRAHLFEIGFRTRF